MLNKLSPFAFIVAIIFITVPILPQILFAQPSLKWTGPCYNNYPELKESGWLIIQNNPPQARFYIFDKEAGTLQIMSSAISTSPSLTIPITSDEYGIEENSNDYSGDGLNDIVVYASYPPPNSRISYRIIDVITGTDIIILDNPSYWYSIVDGIPSDIDSDGKNELVVKRESYIQGDSTVYLVYSTNGIPTSSSSQSKSLPKSFKLHQNYPNPFNPNTLIEYELHTRSDANIEIFDITGRQIHKYCLQNQSAGKHQIAWDGKDRSGTRVSTGTYFYRLNVNGCSSSKKMLLIK